MDEHLLNYVKQSRHNRNSFDPAAVSTRFGTITPMTLCANRLPLVADECIFYEKMKKKPEEVLIDTANYTGAYTVTRISIYFHTNSVAELEEWYGHSRSMLDAGRITYLPNIARRGYSVEEDRDTGETKRWNEARPVLDPPELFQAIPDADVMVSNRDTVPLFNLQIPGFENVTPSQLSQMMDDFPEELLSFRNYLQRRLLSFDHALDSNNFGRELRKIELEIQDGLKKLKSDVRRLKRKAIIEAVGGDAITWSLYVFVFLSSPDHLLKVILPGGAMAAAAKTWAKYFDERSRVKDNDLYFLFLLSNKTSDL